MSEPTISFTKPTEKIPLPIIITIDGDGVGVTSGAENKSIQDKVTWGADNKANIDKAAINTKLNDYIVDQARLARAGGGGGGGGGSAPPPPTRLQEKQAEAATKMNAAIAAATPDSISGTQQAALIKKITDAADENSINVIIAAIPEAGDDAAVIADALKALVPGIEGGKRRRKTNKRARKGKRGTRRHL
jgi:hypothetical protein